MKVVLCLAVLVVMAIADPDAEFTACCQKQGVSSTCEPFCGYNHSEDEVLNAFANGKCSLDKDGPKFYQCLNNEKDNRECCKPKGVSGDCLDLCDGSTQHPFELKYLACKPNGPAIVECGKASH